MSTIELIVKDNWNNIFDLIKYNDRWLCNWCGGQWWFSFTKMFNNLISIREKYKILQYIIFPTLDKNKLSQLNFDMSLLCCMHDIDYWQHNWFIKSNYKLAKNIIRLFHWTKWWIVLWILTFLWTTIFWYKYYNK